MVAAREKLILHDGDLLTSLLALVSVLPGLLGFTMAQFMTVARTRGLLKKAQSAKELLDLVGVKPENVKQRAKAAVHTGFAALAKATDALDQHQRRVSF